MGTLNTEPNLPAPDDFYERLIGLHRDLSDDESARVNAKLVLLLANHIGDPAVLAEAMTAAREGVGGAKGALHPVAGDAPSRAARGTDSEEEKR